VSAGSQHDVVRRDVVVPFHHLHAEFIRDFAVTQFADVVRVKENRGYMLANGKKNLVGLKV
jgi:hypothetical protein